MEVAILIKMFIAAARVTSFSSSSTNKRLLGVFILIGAFGVSRFASCNFVSYKRKIPNFVNNNSNYNVKLYAVVNTRLIVYFICNLWQQFTTLTVFSSFSAPMVSSLASHHRHH